MTRRRKRRGGRGRLDGGREGWRERERRGKGSHVRNAPLDKLLDGLL